jgi:uroporphyrinogen decarboxylase
MSANYHIIENKSMLTRRCFVLGCAGTLGAEEKLTPRERVDRALAGKPLDRPPFSLWHHFGLEKAGPEKHAEATIAFHRNNGTDLVKVMSDFPFPKPAGNWYEVRELKNPFEPQLRALELIAAAVTPRAHFVETIFNPWNVAEKLSSKAAVQQLMREHPQRLLDALEAIAKSEANHARLALNKGASGIFLAIANADAGVLSREEYKKFSEPFDRIVLDAARSAPLNILHIHGSKVYLDEFLGGWGPVTVHYSTVSTSIAIRETRKKFSGVLMGGIDEVSYPRLSVDELRRQARAARAEAGARFILAPGCSVPDDTPPVALKRLAAAA